LALGGNFAPTSNHVPYGGWPGFVSFGFLHIPQNGRNLGLPEFRTPDGAR
jgi:hypothetical protein